ncbi:MAG TPA: aryl-sulfate sulfotransferase [Terriglobales bacterium]|nr:aryl-sulfate sulfotransferase [Terriglobales bacterium]
MLLAAALALGVCSIGCGGSGPGPVAHTENPLVAQYTVSVPAGSTAAVEFGPDMHYGFITSAVTATAPTVSVLVAGMRQNSTYHMRAVVTHADGSKELDGDHVFTTGSAPSGRIPIMAVTLPAGATPTPGIELVSLNPPPNNPGNFLRVVALNPAGELIWYYDFDQRLGTAQPIKLLPNGHFLMVLFGGTTGPGGLVREIDLAGKTIHEFTVDQLDHWLAKAGYTWKANAIHHDIEALPNGHLLVLVNTRKKFTNLPGRPGVTSVLGDAVIDLDQNYKPVWSWSSFDHLDVNRHPMLFPDWTHANTIAYSADDGNIVLSLRNQSWIIKIDYANGHGTGNVIWKLGYQGDFTLLDSASPADWFFAQHYAYFFHGQKRQELQLAVFDNGNNRFPDFSGNICPSAADDVQYPWMTFFGRHVPDCYSRPAVFAVSEAERTVRPLWSQIVPYSYWGGVTMEMPAGDMFYDISSPSEQIARIEKHKSSLTNEVFSELAILMLVLIIFFAPISHTFLALLIVPLVVIVALFPGLGLLAVALGLVIDAGVLVLAQDPRKPEAARTGPRDIRRDILVSLRRINRPSFFAVIAIALSFLPMFGPQERLNAQVMEVTPHKPSQLVWEVDISGQESYRTVHLPSLYPEVQW